MVPTLEDKAPPEAVTLFDPAFSRPDLRSRLRSRRGLPQLWWLLLRFWLPSDATALQQLEAYLNGGGTFAAMPQTCARRSTRSPRRSTPPDSSRTSRSLTANISSPRPVATPARWRRAKMARCAWGCTAEPGRLPVASRRLV